MVVEINGDIYCIQPLISLTLCVSADFKMHKGIALQMRRKFGRIKELRQQKKVTEVAYLRHKDRIIFYIITKEHYWNKLSYENMLQSLKN